MRARWYLMLLIVAFPALYVAGAVVQQQLPAALALGLTAALGLALLFDR